MTIKTYVELPDGELVQFEAENEEELDKKIDEYLLKEFPEE